MTRQPPRETRLQNGESGRRNPARSRPLARLASEGTLRRLAGWTLGVAILWVGASSLSAFEDARDLAPDRDQSYICQAIVKGLKQVSYRDVTLNDGLSHRILDRYLDRLDPSRLFLLARDVKEFQRFANELDDDYLDGDLAPPFEIFNRFQHRRRSQTQSLIAWAQGDVDNLKFESSEVVAVDREGADWPANLEESKQLWRGQFKNDVLNLRLAGRTSEEIADLLGKRYADRLLRIEQTNGGDVFRIYMNVLTSFYGPHTEYFPPHDADNFDITMSLSVRGIGALLGTDGAYCRVERIIPGGPAEHDGRLRATDRIIGVGEGTEGEMVDVVGWRNDDIVDRIRGEKGTVVRLLVLAAGVTDESNARAIVLTRDEVKIEEQEAQKKIVERTRDGRNYRVGVIELPAFYMDFAGAQRGDKDYTSSTRDVARLIEELRQEKVDGIVVDLQGNGGGSLIEANELTGLFVGNSPVVQVRDAKGRVEVLGSEERKTPLYDGPLVVLTDRLSASASEIFAGAIQDTGRGVLVGQRTFGKGTVQGLARLGEGRLKVTQAKFYRISGESTQHAGVAPDIELPSLYNPSEVGESALEDALPWDRIDPVKHGYDATLARYMSELRNRHQARVASNPEFQYITERVEYSDKLASRKFLSLNETERKAQQERAEEELLSMENRRRERLGEEPVKSLDEVVPRADDEPTPYAIEASEILIDLVTLTHGTRKPF